MTLENLTREENKLLEELKHNLKGLLGEGNVRLILFVSRARGDYYRDSDTDVAIIVRGLTRELKNRVLEEEAKSLSDKIKAYLKKKRYII